MPSRADRTSQLGKKSLQPIWPKKVLIGILILVFIVLFPLFQKQPSNEVAIIHTPTLTPTPSFALTPTSSQNIQTFTSPDLGVSFTYNDNSVWDGKPVQVKEIGNRVYLYAWDENPKDGRFIEVFSKNPNNSLPDAITKRFLQGYSIQDCHIMTANLAKIYYERGGFVYAQIGPVEPQNEIESLPQLAAKCPPIYTTINSLKYFLMDKAHPNTFLFFNMGQDTIDSGRTDEILSWDQTIQLLNRK